MLFRETRTRRSVWTQRRAPIIGGASAAPSRLARLVKAGRLTSEGDRMFVSVRRPTIWWAALICALLWLPSGRGQQRPPSPLTENAVIGLLKAGVSSRRIATLVRQRGIGFKLTPEVENQLRRAGADIYVLETLRELSPIPVGSTPQSQPPEKSAATSAVPTGQLGSAAPAAENRSSSPPAPPATAGDRSPTHPPPATAYEEPSDGLKGAAGKPLDAARQNVQSAQAHASLGLALANRGDWAAAIAEDREAIRLDPQNAPAHAQLGSALAQQGSWDGALLEEREAVRLAPDSPLPHASLGAALMQKGDWNGAVAELQEAVRLDPKNADAHFNLGLALIRATSPAPSPNAKRPRNLIPAIPPCARPPSGSMRMCTVTSLLAQPYQGPPARSPQHASL